MITEKVLPVTLVPQIKQALIELGHATELTPDNMVQEIYHKYITVYRTSPLEVPNLPYGIAFLPDSIRNLVAGGVVTPPVDVPLASRFTVGEGESSAQLYVGQEFQLKNLEDDSLISSEVSTSFDGFYEVATIPVGQYEILIDDMSQPIAGMIFMGAVTSLDSWHKAGYVPRAAFSDEDYVIFSTADIVSVPTTLHPSIKITANMFDGCPLFNSPNVSTWDMSAVTSMQGMFSGAVSFNQDLSRWVVSNVTNMANLFQNALSFNQDISSWDVSKVLDMSDMFYYAKAFNQNIANWNVSNVINMESMFSGALAFSYTLASWCVTNIQSLPEFFAEDATLFTIDKHPVWGTCPVV